MDIDYNEAECLKIDAQNKKIYCRSSLSGKEEFVVDYDYLIIAVGANVNTFNTPGVEEHCHFLKVTSIHLVDVTFNFSSTLEEFN